MKNIFIASLVSFASLTAIAQPFALKPGSSVVINGDVISCQGPSEDLLPPACTIKQDGYTYRLYIGTTIAESYSSYTSALDGVKKTKDAGLCR